MDTSLREPAPRVRERLSFLFEKELRDQQDTDYIFGAASPKCRATVPESEREKHLPAGELQYGADDFMDCASRASLNIIEMKLNYLLRKGLLTDAELDWLYNNGYIVL